MTLLLVADVYESEHWFESLWVAYGSLWIIWLLAMRAAIIEQVGEQGGRRDPD
jgi:hypothetical protein